MSQVDGTEENNDPNSMEIPRQQQIVYNGDLDDQEPGTVILKQINRVKPGFH